MSGGNELLNIKDHIMKLDSVLSLMGERNQDIAKMRKDRDKVFEDYTRATVLNKTLQTSLEDSKAKENSVQELYNLLKEKHSTLQVTHTKLVDADRIVQKKLSSIVRQHAATMIKLDEAELELKKLRAIDELCTCKKNKVVTTTNQETQTEAVEILKGEHALMFTVGANGVLEIDNPATDLFVQNVADLDVNISSKVQEGCNLKKKSPIKNICNVTVDNKDDIYLKTVYNNLKEENVILDTNDCTVVNNSIELKKGLNFDDKMIASIKSPEMNLKTVNSLSELKVISYHDNDNKPLELLSVKNEDMDKQRTTNESMDIKNEPLVSIKNSLPLIISEQDIYKDIGSDRVKSTTNQQLATKDSIDIKNVQLVSVENSLPIIIVEQDVHKHLENDRGTLTTNQQLTTKETMVIKNKQMVLDENSLPIIISEQDICKHVENDTPTINRQLVSISNSLPILISEQDIYKSSTEKDMTTNEIVNVTNKQQTNLASVKTDSSIINVEHGKPINVVTEKSIENKIAANTSENIYFPEKTIQITNNLVDKSKDILEQNLYNTDNNPRGFTQVQSESSNESTNQIMDIMNEQVSVKNSLPIVISKKDITNELSTNVTMDIKDSIKNTLPIISRQDVYKPIENNRANNSVLSTNQQLISVEHIRSVAENIPKPIQVITDEGTTENKIVGNTNEPVISSENNIPIIDVASPMEDDFLGFSEDDVLEEWYNSLTYKMTTDGVEDELVEEMLHEMQCIPSLFGPILPKKTVSRVHRGVQITPQMTSAAAQTSFGEVPRKPQLVTKHTQTRLKKNTRFTQTPTTSVCNGYTQTGVTNSVLEKPHAISTQTSIKVIDAITQTTDTLMPARRPKISQSEAVAVLRRSKCDVTISGGKLVKYRHRNSHDVENNALLVQMMQCFLSKMDRRDKTGFRRKGRVAAYDTDSDLSSCANTRSINNSTDSGYATELRKWRLRKLGPGKRKIAQGSVTGVKRGKVMESDSEVFSEKMEGIVGDKVTPMEDSESSVDEVLVFSILKEMSMPSVLDVMPESPVANDTSIANIELTKSSKQQVSRNPTMLKKHIHPVNRKLATVTTDNTLINSRNTSVIDDKTHFDKSRLSISNPTTSTVIRPIKNSILNDDQILNPSKKFNCDEPALERKKLKVEAKICTKLIEQNHKQLNFNLTVVTNTNLKDNINTNLTKDEKRSVLKSNDSSQRLNLNKNRIMSAKKVTKRNDIKKFNDTSKYSGDILCKQISYEDVIKSVVSKQNNAKVETIAIADNHKEYKASPSVHEELSNQDKKETTHEIKNSVLYSDSKINKSGNVTDEICMETNMLHMKDFLSIQVDKNQFGYDVCTKTTILNDINDEIMHKKDSKLIEMYHDNEINQYEEINQKNDVNQDIAELSIENNQDADVNQNGELNQNGAINQDGDVNQKIVKSLLKINQDVDVNQEIVKSLEMNQDDEMNQNDDGNQNDDINQDGDVNQKIVKSLFKMNQDDDVNQEIVKSLELNQDDEMNPNDDVNQDGNVNQKIVKSLLKINQDDELNQNDDVNQDNYVNQEIVKSFLKINQDDELKQNADVNQVYHVNQDDKLNKDDKLNQHDDVNQDIVKSLFKIKQDDELNQEIIKSLKMNQDANKVYDVNQESVKSCEVYKATLSNFSDVQCRTKPNCKDSRKIVILEDICIVTGLQTNEIKNNDSNTKELKTAVIEENNDDKHAKLDETLMDDGGTGNTIHLYGINNKQVLLMSPQCIKNSNFNECNKRDPNVEFICNESNKTIPATVGKTNVISLTSKNVKKTNAILKLLSGDDSTFEPTPHCDLDIENYNLKPTNTKTCDVSDMDEYSCEYVSSKTNTDYIKSNIRKENDGTLCVLESPTSPEYSSVNLDYLSGNIDKSTQNIDYSSSVNIHYSSGNIDNSTRNIDNSSANLENSSVNLDYSSKSLDHSSVNLNNSTTNLDHSPINLDHSTTNFDCSTSINYSAASLDYSPASPDNSPLASLDYSPASPDNSLPASPDNSLPASPDNSPPASLDYSPASPDNSPLASSNYNLQDESGLQKPTSCLVSNNSIYTIDQPTKQLNHNKTSNQYSNQMNHKGSKHTNHEKIRNLFYKQMDSNDSCTIEPNRKKIKNLFSKQMDYNNSCIIQPNCEEINNQHSEQMDHDGKSIEDYSLEETAITVSPASPDEEDSSSSVVASDVEQSPTIESPMKISSTPTTTDKITLTPAHIHKEFTKMKQLQTIKQQTTGDPDTVKNAWAIAASRLQNIKIAPDHKATRKRIAHTPTDEDAEPAKRRKDDGVFMSTRGKTAQLNKNGGDPVTETSTSDKMQQQQQLAWKRAKTMLRNMVQFRSVPSHVQNVVEKFRSLDDKTVAFFLLREIIHDKGALEQSQSPFEPLMTITQKIFLGLLLRLEEERPQCIAVFLQECEQRLLLHEHNTDNVEKITRLYAAICKMRGEKQRLRRTVTDALYFMGDYALPFIFYSLTTWLQLLKINPKPEGTDTNDLTVGGPLEKVLVQTVHSKGSLIPAYCGYVLKSLLKSYYNYPSERYNENKLFPEFLQGFIGNLQSEYEMAILILCKINPTNWVCRQIKLVKELILIVNNKEIEVALVRLITKISLQFEDDEEAAISNVVALLEELQKERLHNDSKKT